MIFFLLAFLSDIRVGVSWERHACRVCKEKNSSGLCMHVCDAKARKLKKCTDWREKVKNPYCEPLKLMSDATCGILALRYSYRLFLVPMCDNLSEHDQKLIDEAKTKDASMPCNIGGGHMHNRMKEYEIVDGVRRIQYIYCSACDKTLAGTPQGKH